MNCESEGRSLIVEDEFKRDGSCRAANEEEENVKIEKNVRMGSKDSRLVLFEAYFGSLGSYKMSVKDDLRPWTLTILR